MNILLAGGIIDFYVEPKKFNRYKTQRGKFNFVERELMKILNSLTGVEVNGITIRDANITSNHFWGMDGLCTVNDLGYNFAYQPKQREDKITIRIMHIDIVGIFENEIPLQDFFFKIKEDNFYLSISSSKLV